VKWIGIAAVGGMGTWGAVEQASQPSVVEQPAAAHVAPAAQRVSQPKKVAAAEPPATKPVAEDEAPVDEPEEVVEEPAARPAPIARRAVIAKPQATSLSDEVAALDRARSRVDDDPERALAAIDAYDRRFGKNKGTLAPEAEVLRIEALAAAGRKTEARARARSFLARHPSSPHAQRVRSVLADTQGH
jgi:hypothetical protein